MAEDQKRMVPGVNIETLGMVLREELRNALGSEAEALTTREYASVFEGMARKLLQRARFRVPVRHIRGRVRTAQDGIEAWVEPLDGSADVYLGDLACGDELLEIVVVEPGRD